MDRENEAMEIPMMGPYSTSICSAMVGLGQAIELALNQRDFQVLSEMQAVCRSMFEQAETAMQSKTEIN